MASNKKILLDAKALANLKVTLKREALSKAKAELEAKRVMANKAISPEVPPELPNDIALFKEAVKDARPITAPPLYLYQKKPKPIPKQFIQDEQQALRDSLSDDYLPAHELETGEELLYLREGHAPDILSKLRRGHWVIQAAIDLHGLISDEARAYVASFISDCKKRGIRCVRIVHGKGLGSRNREPVLKHKLRHWLMQKDEVIAYAEAKKQDGGSGAVIVLLKAS
jgi:DNA-nicking Smr family endonuclease